LGSFANIEGEEKEGQTEGTMLHQSTNKSGVESSALCRCAPTFAIFLKCGWVGGRETLGKEVMKVGWL
jgi:hypothetical protein